MTARAAIPTLLALIGAVALAWQVPRIINLLGLGPASARADDSWYSERLLAFATPSPSMLAPRAGAGLLLLGRTNDPFCVPQDRVLPEEWGVALAFASAMRGEDELRSAGSPVPDRPSGRLAFDSSCAITYVPRPLDFGFIEDDRWWSAPAATSPNHSAD